MKTKCIHYAYPSSIAAEKLGYKHTGCFYVTTDGQDNGLDLKHAKAFASLAQADAYAESLPGDYSPYTIRHGLA